MAKAITHTTEGSQPNIAHWILLIVSVATFSVLAISVPHLIGDQDGFAVHRRAKNSYTWHL